MKSPQPPIPTDLPLRDIHLPDPVSWWPPAPGWWILLGLAVLLPLLFMWLRKRRRKLALHQEVDQAVETLLQNYQQHQDNRQLLHDITALLRRIALSYCERENVAAVTGQAWIVELHKLSGQEVFDNHSQRLLIQAAYMPGIPEHLEPLIEQLRDWIILLPKNPRETRQC